MGQKEPPSCHSNVANSLFRVGRDSHGHWVVQDKTGLRGGLFVSRTEALKYAMFENGNRPQAVIMVPGVLELDISDTRRATQASPAHARVGIRRAA
jgi:hypothetical protein